MFRQFALAFLLYGLVALARSEDVEKGKRPPSTYLEQLKGIMGSGCPNACRPSSRGSVTQKSTQCSLYLLGSNELHKFLKRVNHESVEPHSRAIAEPEVYPPSLSDEKPEPDSVATKVLPDTEPRDPKFVNSSEEDSFYAKGKLPQTVGEAKLKAGNSNEKAPKPAEEPKGKEDNSNAPKTEDRNFGPRDEELD